MKDLMILMFGSHPMRFLVLLLFLAPFIAWWLYSEHKSKVVAKDRSERWAAKTRLTGWTASVIGWRHYVSLHGAWNRSQRV